MQWKCKFCTFTSEKRSKLLKHYRIDHGTYSRIVPVPCLHSDCPCTFKSFNALKVHLSKIHPLQRTVLSRRSSSAVVCYNCHVCDLVELCSDTDYFAHLRTHLRNNEKVQCPFKDCSFETNVYSSFNAHKSKAHHHQQCSGNFKLGIVSSIQNSQTNEGPTDETPAQPLIDSSGSEDEHDMADEQDHFGDIKQKLEHNLASHFLKMQTILHISDSAIQEIIQNFNQLHFLSQSLLSSTIQQIIVKHYGEADSSFVKELVKAVTDSNVLLQCTKEGGLLSTTNRRTSYYYGEFPVVIPVEYKIDDDDQYYVYVPIIQMLQKLLNKTEVLDKVMASDEISEGYSSYRDGTHYKDNPFFAEDDHRISLNLYIDDFEVANPLGTSRKKHKLCAIYWVLANLPAKHLSSLHTIQLALLCKTNVVKRHGYSKILHHLIEDLKCLEQQGVYVEQLGSFVRGAVLHVLADNLGAHSLAGFQESFRVNYPCRFCMATREEIKVKEVRSGFFEMRTKEKHQQHVQDVQQDSTLLVQYGVKSSCPLSVNLKHFHAIGGFPPDLLHDLLEGIVPVEMALCLQDLIGKRYFSLESLNVAIKQFPYKFSDRTDQPQPIPQSFSTKKTIGGNGHENCTLLRLLPLLIGHNVGENDCTWQVLMLLKDIVELSMSVKFTDDTVEFLNCKISEHRALLQKVFPNFVLRPKHHYVEHYPQLIRLYGPLRNLWTMRFEGKHKFFKRVIRDAQNFKNVPLMLAKKHQMTIAYHMDASSFFKPGIQMDRVTSSLVTSFPVNVQEYLHLTSPNCSTVLVSPSVTIDGIKYCPDMVVSVGSCSGLPEFVQIEKVLVINTDIMFLCKPQTAWYVEHLRSYELCSLRSLQVILPSELNDPFPLAAYIVREYQLDMSMILRVIVHDGDIRKVVIPDRPADVDALKHVLQEKLQVSYSFNVQYEDPDFNNALCNVSDINDLPERATLKIIPLSTSPSSSQTDTVILTGSDTSEQFSAERQSEWPEDFEIPKFSVNVEYRLRQGNLAFMKDGTYLNVGRDIKHDILETLAGAMYNFKAYPRDGDFAQVAAALIKAHPCLTEPGSSTGSTGWKNSLKFKMANYRTKLRRSGCTDVAVEGKRGATMDGMLKKGIKKPRRFELNFLPNFPNGENEESQVRTRVELKEEMKKKTRNMSLIGQKMDSTFALRRKEIIHSEPPVFEILEKWPALFTESQVFAEFSRISGKNLRSEFYAALDTHSARLIEIFRKKGGNQGQALNTILGQVDLKSSDVTCVRTAVLHGLPILLGDDSGDFFRMCFDSDVNADFSEVDVGLLTVLPEETTTQTPHALNVDSLRAIILEGRIVMDDVPNLPQAVCLLFALIYALNLNYPKTMKNTFDCIQRVFLLLGSKNLKPKLQTLKNQLLAKA